MKNKKRIFILILILFACLAYSNSLSHPFVWDDRPLIVENPHLALPAPDLVRHAFRSPITPEDPRSRSYRPLQTVSYKLNLLMAGTNPVYFRGVNVALHALNAFLLFLILGRIGARPVTVFFTPLFFLLHPLNVPAVTYISGRADPLALVFLLAGFYEGVRHLGRDSVRPAKGLFIRIAAWWLAALFTRESSVLFPLFAGISMFFACPDQLRKFRGLTVPLSVALIIYTAARFAAFHGTEKVLGSDPLFWERVSAAPLTGLRYLAHMLFPWNLSMDYSPEDMRPALVAVSGGLLLILFWGAWRMLRKSSTGKGLYIFFLLSCLPILNIFVSLNAAMADHWLYIPQIGFFGMILEGAFGADERSKRVWYPCGVLLCAIFSCFLAWRTIIYNSTWKNEKILFEYVLKFSPENPRPLYNLARVHFNEGRFDDAFTLVNKTLNISSHPDAYLLRANIYRERGNWMKAFEDLRACVDRYPGFAKGWANLGGLYLLRGDRERALICLRKALSINPHLDSVKRNLAIAEMAESSKLK